MPERTCHIACRQPVWNGRRDSEWIWRLARSKQLFGPLATDQITLGSKWLFSFERAGSSTTEGSFHCRGCILWELSLCAFENPSRSMVMVTTPGGLARPSRLISTAALPG